jgi:hypothetical protein
MAVKKRIQVRDIPEPAAASTFRQLAASPV